MPRYYNIKFTQKLSASQKKRTLNNLVKLRAQLKKEIPTKDSDETLVLGTWNIREFGRRPPKFKRLYENLYYFAEIISRFDLVAVQEVNDLGDLEDLMYILGNDWEYIATDVSDQRAGGNGERMCFIYDTRKVKFKNVAGEIVLPANLLISKTELESKGKKVVAGKQFRRTPFVVSFQAGWFRFDLCTVHIYYGTDSGPKLQERIGEINAIASYMSKRAKNVAKTNEEITTILLGDFNIMRPGHKTMDALLDNGFDVPMSLRKQSNMNLDKFYDQIAFFGKKKIVKLKDEDSNPDKESAGVFQIDKEIYNDWSLYEDDMRKTKGGKGKRDAALEKYFKNWRTFQTSDHHLMWVQLKVNSSTEYINELRQKYN